MTNPHLILPLSLRDDKEQSTSRREDALYAFASAAKQSSSAGKDGLLRR
jgi:hypothetical protein